MNVLCFDETLMTKGVFLMRREMFLMKFHQAGRNWPGV